MTDSFTAFLYDTLENTRNENFAHPNPEYLLPYGKVACPRSVVLCDSGRLAGFGAAIMTNPSMRQSFETLAHTSRRKRKWLCYLISMRKTPLRRFARPSVRGHSCSTSSA